MKKLVMLMLLVISLVLMGYGFYQMYLDTYVRPVLGYVGYNQYPDPIISSVTIVISGVLLLSGLYLYTNYDKELTAWKEERCPHCGKKIH
jgi:hypothetical protein